VNVNLPVRPFLKTNFAGTHASSADGSGHRPGRRS
jgi:hypothetical protein